MIYSITPNPTLDLSGTVCQIVPNEKTYVHHELRTPGGNALNAARIIREFQVPVLATGFLGGGIGAEIEGLLNQEKIRHRFIQIQGNTRINVTVSEEETHLQTRLSFPGPEIRSSEKEALFRFISQIRPSSLVLMGGSLPPSFSNSDVLKIIQIAQSRQAAVIVDSPGAILKKAIQTSPILIKPNLVEFQALVGKSVSSLGDVLANARKLLKKVSLICISSVEGGALFVTPVGAWFGMTPRIKIKTTVGAGDSMVGAMAAMLWKKRCLTGDGTIDWKKMTPQVQMDILKWGLASAAATLSLPGLVLGEGKLIRSFYPQIQVRQI